MSPYCASLNNHCQLLADDESEEEQDSQTEDTKKPG